MRKTITPEYRRALVNREHAGLHLKRQLMRKLHEAALAAQGIVSRINFTALDHRLTPAEKQELAMAEQLVDTLAELKVRHDDNIPYRCVIRSTANIK